MLDKKGYSNTDYFNVSKSFAAGALIALAVFASLAGAAIFGAEEAEAATFRQKFYKMKSGKILTMKDIRKEGGSKNFFQSYKIKKNDRVYKRMNGKSLPKGNSASNLSYVKLIHIDFKGRIKVGELVVSRRVSKRVKKIFYKLYKHKYQIRKMHLIDNYFPKKFKNRDKAARKADKNSMNKDNSSAFNYRHVADPGSGRAAGLSAHSYGTCIDINPFENPWAPGGKVAKNQRRSAKYANRRNKKLKHMIHRNSYITKVFEKYGFGWGAPDYQHFQY